MNKIEPIRASRRRLLWPIAMLLVVAAALLFISKADAAHTLSLATPPPAAAGDTVATKLLCTTDSVCGMVQVSVNYNSNVVRFLRADIGPDIPNQIIWDVIENPYWGAVIPGCDRAVVVQIYHGPFAQFGPFLTDKWIATLKWIVEPGTCGVSPIINDPSCDHSQIVTYAGLGLCPPTATWYGGQASQFCGGGGGGGCSPNCELEKPAADRGTWTATKMLWR